jgi:hypothetical protein
MREVRLHPLSAFRPLMIGLLVCATASAQAELVRMSGRVQDSSGADASNICVTLKMAGSPNTASAMLTNENGEFFFNGITPNTYDLSFRARGWASRSLAVGAVRENIVIPPTRLEIAPSTTDYDIDWLMRTRSFGTVEVHEGCSVDLDQGKATCPTKIDGPSPRNNKADDLRLERQREGLYLTPENGAVLALGKTADLKGHRSCDSPRYSDSRIRIDNLSEGTPVCVRTNEGRPSFLAVWLKEPPQWADRVCIEGDISIEYVTSKRDDETSLIIKDR